ncbi:G-type lectin S-receptor-like serine/threonine-protein kinase [Platanthera guangdongensis]|uniref:G-type lectin S-receptor-like serine/threonine-protein kinase n=1 Tax=Platanthera guangdongensis TaxID=2320717 RepID=A0ABR2LX42_9ASPA
MPGGWLGVDLITGEYQSLTSWKSADDPAPGLFGQSMNPDGSDEYVLIWNGTNIYWASGLWNGQYFASVPGTREKTVFNFSFSHNKQRKFATYTINVKSIITRYVVDSEGQGRQWYWLSNTQQWQTEFTQPLAHCAVYSLCGPFGVCDGSSSDSICRCVEGFEPASDQEWKNSDWSSGCSRKSQQLRCEEEEDGFFNIPNMNLPPNSVALNNNNNISTEAECRETCLKNCSCTAFVYDHINGCSIWKDKIRNLQQLGDGRGESLFIRVSASDLRSSNAGHVVVALGVVAGVVGLLVIAVIGLICVYRRRKKALSASKIEGSSLVQFSYIGLRRITKNFSEKIGSGGFGSVFKGTLLNSTPVAVKRLEGAMQGEKQFRAEVSTLGSIQHVNLVRLHGFCSEGNKKLLVYELMPKSSLASLLFRHDHGSTELDWKLRFRIILGAARGLAYLHEECRECIVHCDVKPDNVLLDAEYNAKVSDFGMAKLIGRDFSRVLTTMRGTVGYLAPEWISGSPITPKVDVYSYGMMLFEVVSGKRNAVSGGDENTVFYPSWAAGKVVEGDVESLLDERLEGEADAGQLTRVCRVACWCVQDVEDLRPGMGQVVQILEGGLEVNVPPLPDSLRNMISSSSRSDFIMSLNEEDGGDITRLSAGVI